MLGSRARFAGGVSAAVLAAVVLSGCNFAPDFETPQVGVPLEFRNDPAAVAAREGEAAPQLPRPASKWWEAFASEELNGIVEEALANNHDLKAAARRISQSGAQETIAESLMLPTLGITSKNTLSAPRTGQGSTDNGIEGRSERLWVLGGTVSYELDLWGKNRGGIDAAVANNLVSVFDRDTIAMTLVADTVNAYLQFVQAADRVHVAQRTIVSMESGLQATQDRVRIGESTEIELSQQRHQLATARATIPPLMRNREEARNRLAALMGRSPSALNITTDTIEALKVPVVKPGVPSDLLRRRPDIRKAEANLMAANANIGVARSKLLPTFALTGERGLASQSLEVMLRPLSIYYTLTAQVTATIFDWGKTSAEIDSAKQRHAELVELYRQAVLNSLRDVEDALVATRYTAETEVAQGEVLRWARRSYSLAEEAFRLGMVDYLYLLESERSKFAAEDSRVQIRYNRLLGSVLLFKAMGGGVDDPPAEPQG
jgi:NodT family efflux transporter outer membrane factor (OMF) lipoprotein